MLPAIITCFLLTRCINNRNKKLYSLIVFFHAGTLIINLLFSQLDYALKQTNIWIMSSSVLCGMMLCTAIDSSFKKQANEYAQHGKMFFFNIAVCTLVHGISIGIGVERIENSGYIFLIAMLFIELPKYLSLTLTLLCSFRQRVYAYTCLFIIPVLFYIAIFTGSYFGHINRVLFSVIKGISGGVMLYTVFGALIPAALKRHFGKSSVFAVVSGIITAIIYFTF